MYKDERLPDALTPIRRFPLAGGKSLRGVRQLIDRAQGTISTGTDDKPITRVAPHFGGKPKTLEKLGHRNSSLYDDDLEDLSNVKITAPALAICGPRGGRSLSASGCYGVA